MERFPQFYHGTLYIEGETAVPVVDAAGHLHLADTFLDTTGLGKGLVWVNGFLLGWYWPEMGPQMTLYVPGPVLKRGDNSVLILESNVELGEEAVVQFVSEPNFWGGGGGRSLYSSSSFDRPERVGGPVGARVGGLIGKE